MNMPENKSDSFDLSDLPGRAVRNTPKKTAFAFNDRQHTYQDVATTVSQLTLQYRRYFKSNELVALWLPNCPELLYAYISGFQAGVISMPLHHDYKFPEVKSILRKSACRHLIVLNNQLDDEILNELDDVELDQVWGIENGVLHPLLPGMKESRANISHVNRPVGPESIGLVLHTSGSTGQSKGVMISRSSLMHIIQGRIECAEIDEHSVAIVASSLVHSVGLYQALAFLSTGSSFVLMQSYEVSCLSHTINNIQPTHLIMVVSAFEKLLMHPLIKASSFKNIKFSSVGADRVTSTVQEKYYSITGKTLSASYGMTELSWMIIHNSPDPDISEALGRPAPGVEIKLLDQEGNEVKEGEVGEIYARSPKQMEGYLNDPDMTQRSVLDGWVKSGDLALKDVNGIYWFIGREKDLIVLHSGDTVSPVEIEQEILKVPGVRGCVVIGMRVQDEYTHSLSEVPWAFITHNAAVPESDEILRHLGKRISDYKLPRKLIFLDHLPEGMSGKVIREKIRDKWSGSSNNSPELHDLVG
ncbi:hypothetical protein BOW35_12680 [Solemya velum gill symbiont]|uniref:class I adenylate-forming enzyme family protein n=1 Tax=Solemya velum gill symbiont TaxID=2340 RepID=UPI000997859C|nr:class I adenylate-forming enzyme family protein [Solemya velum gill symbiont]OOZ16476.1 hypothetical protein BOW28_10300 [Solemya velum gill symbiont]OOZ20167.1 hypothetical protein BOW30_12505 [Solemya velum gill symbiont]OOZ21507.1 hypothetical protein BOW31_12610 [Solemya velum gill symbiont]OOZ26066.1 hypothetical protein BOW32_09855 [Solemya velum gill symbiont]OOZ26541.1 hypothetical protein BOW33_12650 [Solemya velum gill symbiont]